MGCKTPAKNHLRSGTSIRRRWSLSRLGSWILIERTRRWSASTGEVFLDEPEKKNGWIMIQLQVLGRWPCTRVGKMIEGDP